MALNAAGDGDGAVAAFKAAAVVLLAMQERRRGMPTTGVSRG
jgi:hypothetical protein